MKLFKKQKKEEWVEGIGDSMLMSFVWNDWKLSIDLGDMYYFEKEIKGHIGSMYAENCYDTETPDDSAPLLDRLWLNYCDFDNFFSIDGEDASKCTKPKLYEKFRSDLRRSLIDAENTRKNALSYFK